uniref:ankyrin repeat domain-containing protein 34C-like n=1 Tax=Myxine glutinosa TaxID=7769 RepID=UPI00358F19C4
MDGFASLRIEGNSLLRAVYLGRLRLTRVLLEGGAYVNESNDRGETPLMIACLSHHTDLQSVSKLRMVSYLLHNKADPKIQDKTGRTALMHACLHSAGTEVVQQLLKHGADPSLEDHSGRSALRYAVEADERDILQVLLDACRACGKEVIIITTERAPDHASKQPLGIPSPPTESTGEDEQAPCASLSDINLGASCQELFNFTNNPPVNPCPPLHPAARRGPLRHGGFLPQLKRLRSEPWGLIAPSVASANSGIPPLVPSIPVNEETSKTFPSEGQLPTHGNEVGSSTRVRSARSLIWQESMNTGNSGLLYTPTPLLGYPGVPAAAGVSRSAPVSRKGSFEPSSPRHEAERKYTDEPSEECSSGTMSPSASFSLYPKDAARWLSLPVEVINGEPGSGSLPSSPDLECLRLARKKASHSPLISQFDSRESVEASSPRLSRDKHPLLERRGSGTILVDRISQTRPGFLPALNVNLTPPIPDICSRNRTGTSNGPAVLSPVALPKRHISPEPTPGTGRRARKTLLRRHSMQVEQMKQLVSYGDLPT